MSTYTQILHSSKNLSDAKINKLWDIICEKSEGTNVENLRRTYNLENNLRARRKVIKRQQYLTKSKLGSLSWDPKQFQAVYIFGLPTIQNQTMREGTNKHAVAEVLPEYCNLDDIITYYNDNGAIVGYIHEKCKQSFIDLVSNSEETDLTYEQALNMFEKDEAQNYQTSFMWIAKNYNNRLNDALEYDYIESVVNYLFPLWVEAIIYDDENWLMGVVDAIFKTYDGLYLPVDYKFGKPKEKYYLAGIGSEMSFYKYLVMNPNCYYKNEFSDKRRKRWNALYCETGEMWYILDGQHGVNKIEYSDKWDKKLWKNINAYWKAMDNMDYAFQPEYGGWPKKSRYENFCNKKDEPCDWLNVCKQGDSMRNWLSLNSLGDDIFDV